jgi:hypothetical protein
MENFNKFIELKPIEESKLNPNYLIELKNLFDTKCEGIYDPLNFQVKQGKRTILFDTLRSLDQFIFLIEKNYPIGLNYQINNTNICFDKKYFIEVFQARSIIGTNLNKLKISITDTIKFVLTRDSSKKSYRIKKIIRIPGSSTKFMIFNDFNGDFKAD